MKFDHPATDWAWDQIQSPNLDFEGTLTTFLGLAYLADVALNSPHGYSWTAAVEVATLTRQDVSKVSIDLADLGRAGLAVRQEGVSGWRIPEEAFNRPDSCSRCVFGEVAYVVRFKGAARDEATCSTCTARAVEANEIARLCPVEAGGAYRVADEALVKGGRD